MSKRRLLRFESKNQPLLPREAYLRRVFRSFGAAIALILFSLLLGMWGYHYWESQPWIDAFANASMILSGMGPLDSLKTEGGKIFAGLYALYSGLVLVLASGIVLAPVVHRFLHRFHLEDEDKK